MNKRIGLMLETAVELTTKYTNHTKGRQSQACSFCIFVSFRVFRGFKRFFPAHPPAATSRVGDRRSSFAEVLPSFLKDKMHHGHGAFELGGIADEVMILAGMDNDFRQDAGIEGFGLESLQPVGFMLGPAGADQNFWP